MDGKQYEIDLGAKNAKNLRKAVAAYIEAGRKVRASNAPRATTKKTTRSTDMAAVRAWAQENDIPVASRGRIPASLLEQYKAATAN